MSTSFRIVYKIYFTDKIYNKAYLLANLDLPSETCVAMASPWGLEGWQARWIAVGLRIATGSAYRMK
jgi:hypothetical protein